MKPKEYYEALERDYGVHARRAAEMADRLADELDEGATTLAQAFERAAGSAYREEER